ncbi:DUF3574 domain-containing protein [Komagataeibacter sp. FNDCF1]|uniref:DUF3574 domain-containing protein n=1 Tax=Komagataeibacter sp. FNDCF1 TaxID=2878681 RepID=UPI001E6577E1|nr:DUF3574 domain-containing protein [Komagataeibacter sp. FNDCF1]MCE2563486.1 DUF3574 domain-containing protein [Komagataeibacter sp. FNDCF1]
MAAAGMSSSRFIRMLRGMPVIALLAGLAGPATQSCQARMPDATMPAQSVSCTGLQATPQLEITLLFGLRRPDGGGRIGTHAWNTFVRQVITPRFPAGLTVLRGDGQWQDRTGGQVSHEPSRIVWIVTPATADLPARLDAIRQAYRQRFAQQSVGLVVTAVCAAF